MLSTSPAAVVWAVISVALAGVPCQGAEASRPDGAIDLSEDTAPSQLPRLPLAGSRDLLPLFPPLGTPPPPTTVEEVVLLRLTPLNLSKKRGQAFDFGDVAVGADLGRQPGNDINVDLSPKKISGIKGARSSSLPSPRAKPELFADDLPTFLMPSHKGKAGGRRPFRPSIRLHESPDGLLTTEDGALLRAVLSGSARRKGLALDSPAKRGHGRRRPGSKLRPLVLSRPTKARTASSRAAKRRSSRLTDFRPSPRADESIFQPSGPRGLAPERSGALFLNR